MRKKELLARIEALEREVKDLEARLEAEEMRPWPWTVPVYPTWPTYPASPVTITPTWDQPNVCDITVYGDEWTSCIPLTA